MLITNVAGTGRFQLPSAFWARRSRLENVQVNALQVCRQRELQAVVADHVLVDVAEHVELELGLLGKGKRMIRRLRADGDQRCAAVADLGKRCLQGAEIKVAVRAPVASVELEDDGTSVEPVG